ncbi:hypothetical protein KFZ70_13090 [Tamlana fucoidanivorans]|uniref:Uncharacterized protein n=1 Tax=Allotamlana fucoidanivorans TaxID=2583814 RepID=A0A5C4SQK9_9FLAO|nr:hypothetical protein [Tamlana fucoidanivorans]TNJ46367.1 hypothetical protein FGF67_01715 [Tamlana fucoidanivorans]
MNIPLPDFNSISQICDWIELYILCDSTRLSKSKLNNLLNSYGVYGTDVLITDVMAELSRREFMMGEGSAFRIDNRGVIRRNGYIWEDIPEYVMCLIFSLQGVKKIKGDDDGTKLFERIGKDVIASYLDGKAIVLGFPNDTGLNQQLIDFSIASNEIKSKDRNPANTDKDKGVDIIGWKSHSDKRNNQIVLLIQAAAGYHWNLKKAISKNAWRDFILWSAPFNIGIIIVSTLDEIKFEKARDDYDNVFDRIRIFIALYKKNHTIDNELRQLVREWCVKELN